MILKYFTGYTKIMRTIAFSHDAIIAPFFDKKILTKAELLKLTGCSNMTLFRRLSEHGYYTSYNFNSRYYTIAEVARFDRKGLWEYHDVRFSNHGTLKATIRHLVSTSEMGCTANQLAQLLGVRVASFFNQAKAQELLRWYALQMIYEMQFAAHSGDGYGFPFDSPHLDY
jgi:hypothetical protein